MRAILLAAGMGTRLRPITLTTPKSLVPVNGVPMAERQIEFLKEVGIEDIIVVTGYLHESFNYLKEKYGVKLIHNDKYDVYNNIYTMYLVKDYLKNSYVIDADIYLNNNFFLESPKTSLYFSAKKRDFQNEWMLRFKEDLRVYDIEVGTKEEDYILSGVSFWSEKDGEKIVKKLEEAIKGGDFTNLYWDDIVKDNIKDLEVYVHKIGSEDVFEVDSIEDLRKVEAYLNMQKN